jgi:3-deoxy-7-phosphoheptulonate synthase
MSQQDWSPTSWQTKPCAQAVEYPCQTSLTEVVRELSVLPGLVSVSAIAALQQQLAKAMQGEVFVLQAGDCAERFCESNLSAVRSKLNLLFSMGAMLAAGLAKPIVHVGRIAGQYAKPRSQEQESRLGSCLPSYRGDMINSPNFSLEERTPSPPLLRQAYQSAKSCLYNIQTVSAEGIDVHALLDEFMLTQAPHASELILAEGQIKQPLYTSHEALHLYYEQALTRHVTERWYDLATHFPWLGMRTSQPDHAHVEYASGIANPIAVKIGSKVTAESIRALLAKLNPHNEAGRLTFIYRFGLSELTEKLPWLIDIVQTAGYQVAYFCDPMHGNTQRDPRGYKRRYFAEIMAELLQASAIHQRLAVPLAGVHLEMMNADIVECEQQRTSTLSVELTTLTEAALVDPRLNTQQALSLIWQLIRAYQASTPA